MRSKPVLFIALLFVFSIGPRSSIPVSSRCIINPCSTTVSVPSPTCLVVCPQGDGPTLAEAGVTIEVIVKDPSGTLYVGVPPSDIWLVGCSLQNHLCGGSSAINADGPTDENGFTTISGALAACGNDDGVVVFVEGLAILDPENCTERLCLPIRVVSPDVNCDFVVDLIDFSMFGQQFPSPPAAYDRNFDYDDDGEIGLIDFSIFGEHFLHNC